LGNDKDREFFRAFIKQLLTISRLSVEKAKETPLFRLFFSGIEIAV
jgi:hypothetical protein